MRTLILVGFATIAVAPIAGTQQRPDLSGTWVAATGQTPANLPAAPGPIMGTRFVLAVDATKIVLTRPVVGDVSMAATMPLDGTPTRMAVPGRLCEGERVFEESAKWEGDALLVTIVSTTPPGGGTPLTPNNRRLIRLEAPDRVVVEGTMTQQGQTRQVGAVYVRSTDDPMPPMRATPPVALQPATISQVAWIGTRWRGTTGTTTTEESWTPPASGGMMATARTLRTGNALASFEFLCIAERSGSLAYIAMPDGRTTPTYFWLTAVTDSSATFENPSHDYPQMIRYRRTAEGGLETTIAATGGARARSVVLQPEKP